MADPVDPLEQFQATFNSPTVPPGFGNGATEFTYHHPPLPPLKVAVPESSIKQLFAHRQWRAGILMADRIADGTINVRGERVIEMGAGTGLPGILSVLKGSELTVISDYDDEKLLSFLRRNVDSTLSGELRNRAKVIGHIWGQDPEDLIDCCPNKYTRIICADVLWDTFSHHALLTTLLTLLARTPSARIIVISGLHTGRDPLAHFLRMASFRGLVPDIEGIREREVGGEIRVWDEQRPDGDILERNRWTCEFNLMWS